MKNKIILIACIGSIGFLAACSGNHASNNGKDTEVNTYNAVETSNKDTAAIHSAENSASGGVGALPKISATVVKDTTKK